MHKEILSLCYFSQGGFNWKDTYSEIPVHLRRYYLKELEEILKKQQPKENTPSKAPKVHSPGVAPRGGAKPRMPAVPRKR